MTSRAQITKQAAPLQLGQRKDAAESRVSQRLRDEPALHALHEGALDRLPEPHRHGPDSVPGSVNAAFADGGRPLESGLRRNMESAFGEDLGHVRIHDTPLANAAARDIGGAAFAAGSDIGFARGAYRPDTPKGRGVIAHELAHASEARAGRDASNMVRRFDLLEWFDGADEYSESDLAEFLNNLRNETPGSAKGWTDFTMDSDNKARAIVAKGFHKAQTLHVRYRLIEHLMDGAVLQGDERSIMQILNDASEIERENLIAQVGKERLYDKIDDRQRNADLKKMIEGGLDKEGSPVGGTETTKRGDIPVTWRMNHTIKGDPKLSGGVAGLEIKKVGAKPQGRDYGPFAFDVTAPGLSGRDQVLAEDEPHPKNTGGQADLTFWVIPKDDSQQAAYEEKTETALPLQAYAPVQAVEGQVITADLDVEMVGQRVSEETLINRSMIGKDSGEENKTGRKEINTSGSGTNITNERTSGRNAEVSEGAEVNASASKGRSKTLSASKEWQVGVSRTVELMKQFQKSEEFSTTDDTETSVRFSGTVHGQIDTDIQARIKAAGDAGLSLKDLGAGMIGKLLGYLPIPQSKTIAAILSMLGSADVNLNVSLEAEATGGVKMAVGGSLTGEAAKMWRHSETKRNSTVETDGVTDTMGVTGSVGGSAGAAVTDNEEKNVGASRQKGVKVGASTGERKAVESSAHQEKSIEDSAERTLSETLRREDEITKERKTDVLVPDVKTSLTFHVEKDIWGGSITAKKADEQQPADAGKKRKAGKKGEEG